MLGFAWQKGRVPLSLASLLRAIELNGVQVDNNKAAFEWGRRAASDPQATRALVRTGQVIELVKRSTSLDDLVAKRVEFLTAYQSAAYAARYKGFVDKLRAAELREEERQGRAAEAALRPVDAVGVSPPREAEVPARHAVRSVRPHRGAPRRARTGSGVPRVDRGGGARTRA